MTDDTTRSTMDRRTFVRRAGTVGAAGAMVWATPSVTTLSRAFGATNGSPDCGRPMPGDNFELISAPAQAFTSDKFDTSKTQIWLERSAYALPRDVTLDAPNTKTNLPAGTLVSIYMIHSATGGDPAGPGGHGVLQGVLGFDGELFGGINQTAALVGSDDLSDAPGRYDAATFRGYELKGDDPSGDSWIFPDSKSVSIYSATTTACDQMRLFVACVVPTD